MSKKKQKKIKRLTFYNPLTWSLYLFVFGRLIQRTSSPSTTALFTGRKKKILSVIQERAGQQSPSASDLPLIHFGAVSAAKHLPSSALWMMKWDDPGVTEWSSSWWPHWGRHQRAPGRPACLSVSRRRRPGGEVADKTGGVSSVRPHSPNESLSIRQQGEYLGLCWKTNWEFYYIFRNSKMQLGIWLPQDMSNVKWFNYYHDKITDIGKIYALFFHEWHEWGMIIPTCTNRYRVSYAIVRQSNRCHNEKDKLIYKWFTVWNFKRKIQCPLWEHVCQLVTMQKLFPCFFDTVTVCWRNERARQQCWHEVIMLMFAHFWLQRLWICYSLRWHLSTSNTA